MPPVCEMQNVMMLQLVDEGRIVDLNELLVAVKVGDGHIEVERMTGRQQRRHRMLRDPHGIDRVVHQCGHHLAVQWRLEPARAHEQRKFLAHLHVVDQVELPVLAAPR